MKQSNKLALISVMFCFFCMGFVDLVGIASNYVKADLQLTDSVANIFPSLVFFWFLFFSVPTSVLMNKIGKKNTVLLSLIITVVSLVLPIFGENFPIMLAAFSLLGIGNAFMQTSLNPLVTCVMKGNLASALNLGQFVKAFASLIAPYLAMWGATAVIPSFGLDWRVLFAIFFVVGILAAALLASMDIAEPKVEAAQYGIGTQFINAFKLLLPSGFLSPDNGGTEGGEKTIEAGRGSLVLLSFLGIICHVGIDVGTNTTAPKLLIERLGMTLNEAAFATSLYFIGRTIGAFTGSMILQKLKTKYFFIICVICMAISMVCMFIGQDATILYTGIFLVGYGNANVFSMCFANALQTMPEKQNEVSGLMIMGLAGGAAFPLAMGVASDAMGQAGAVACMAIGVLYLFTYIPRLKN